MKSRPGFTLLELLVALAISAAVIVAVAISFSTWVRAQERAELTMDKMRSTEFALKRLRETIGTSYVPFTGKAENMTFKGMDTERPSEPFDALTFVSVAHRTMRREAKQSEVMEMTVYAVGDPELEDGDRCRILRLREGGTINDRFEVEGGMVTDLAEHVSRFQLFYLNQDAALKSEWDVQESGALPCAVVVWLGVGCADSEQDQCLFLPLKLTNAKKCEFDPEQLKDACNIQQQL
jgi:prepilin-type N-terminal cleavage/methylation domain-containing protein